MSIEAIAREVLDCTCSASSLEFKPLPVDDPKRRKPLITTAEKLLGWQPTDPVAQRVRGNRGVFRSGSRQSLSGRNEEAAETITASRTNPADALQLATKP